MSIQFCVRASACNANGAFDAAYSFGNGVGDEGGMVGFAQEIGREVTRFLSQLTEEDCRTMRYGTKEFAIDLYITPLIDGLTEDECRWTPHVGAKSPRVDSPDAIGPAEVSCGTQPNTGLRYATCRGWRLVAYAEGGSCHQQWGGDPLLGWILCPPDQPMPPDVEMALERALDLAHTGQKENS